MTMIVYQDEGDNATNIGKWFAYNTDIPDSDVGPFDSKEEAELCATSLMSLLTTTKDM